jgi:uncharacterized protein (TIGR02246 family)
MVRTQSGDRETEHIRQVVRSSFEAWNQRDISKVVAVFSEDAEVAKSLGLWWSGLTEITRGPGARTP